MSGDFCKLSIGRFCYAGTLKPSPLYDLPYLIAYAGISSDMIRNMMDRHRFWLIHLVYSRLIALLCLGHVLLATPTALAAT